MKANFLFCFTILVSVLLGDCSIIKKYTPLTTARHVAESKCNDVNILDGAVIDKFTDGLENILPCIRKAKKKVVRHPITDFDEDCNSLTNSGAYECLTSLAEKAQPCLGPDEDYLPEMILTSYNKTRKSVCDPEERAKLEPIAARANNWKNIGYANLHEALHACLLTSKLHINRLQTINFVLKKKYLCSDLQTVFDCTVETLNGNSGDDYSDLLNVSLGSYLDWCSTH